MIGVMVPSVFAEIVYDEEQNFRIDLPNNLKSMDYSQFYHLFKFSENIEPYSPMLQITYGGTDDAMIGGSIKNESWEFQSYCDAKTYYGRDTSYTYRPYGYAYDLNCEEFKISEIKEWDVNDVHYKKITEDQVWKSEQQNEGFVNNVKSIRMHITSGIEFWNVGISYDLESLNSHPDLDNQITEILDSFEPVTCSENTLTTINLEGEKNPILKKRYQYFVTVINPVSDTVNYSIMGQNSTTYKIENHPNTEYSDSGLLSGNADSGTFSVNFEVYFRNISYNEGESFIKITNGCTQESFPINIWETEPILKEEISDVKEIKIIPSWVKNNAGWWAEGTIDDDSFVQGIQFLIKEGIIVVDSTFQGTEESKEIPTWIKNNAGWWADGTIDDNSFIQGIQFLVKEGIIQVN